MEVEALIALGTNEPAKVLGVDEDANITEVSLKKAVELDENNPALPRLTRRALPGRRSSVESRQDLRSGDQDRSELRDSSASCLSLEPRSGPWPIDTGSSLGVEAF